MQSFVPHGADVGLRVTGDRQQWLGPDTNSILAQELGSDPRGPESPGPSNSRAR